MTRRFCGSGFSRNRICGSGFSRDLLVAAALAMFAGAAGAQEPVGLERGKQVFDQWCAACHGDGPGKPGTAALNALYKGQKPALLEERTDLVPELTKQFVRTGVSVMPFFRKTEISDADLEALAQYLAP
jgi:mono/diheme cytochrome c family protein